MTLETYFNAKYKAVKTDEEFQKVHQRQIDSIMIRRMMVIARRAIPKGLGYPEGRKIDDDEMIRILENHGSKIDKAMGL